MPLCKINYCREQAIPHGKRYCTKHMAEYKAKQAEYAKRGAEAPKCVSCGVTPLMSSGYVRGGLCHVCKAREEEERERHTKVRMFENAETVHELKEWLREYSGIGDI